MALALNISPGDQSTIARAVGAATLNKLRGQSASLVQSYQAQGGGNSEATQTLSQFDKGFSSVDLSSAAKALSGGGDFASTYQGWNMSSSEQALVETAIGTAILNKIEGKGGDMLSAYQAAGGSQPEAIQAFQKVEALFAKGSPESLKQS